MNDPKLRGVLSPNVIRPPSGADPQKFARRVANEVTSTLLQARAFNSFGTLATRATLKAAGVAAAVNDIGGVGGTIYEAARTNKRITGEVRAIAGAAAHAKVAGQIGFDLARARVEVSKATEIARSFKSPAAESALVFMRPELQRLEAAFGNERGLQMRYQEIAKVLQGKIGAATSSKLGEIAVECEKVAWRSNIGRGILGAGRILATPWVSKSLFVLGVGAAAIKGYSEAPTQAETWKVAHGAGAAATSAVAQAGMVAAVKTRGMNPAALLIDPALKYGLGKTGEKLTIGSFYEDASKNIVALTQGLKTGDLVPLHAMHRQNMSGNGHMVIRGYAMIGDSLSRTSLIDTALTKAADWHIGVPADFRTSSSWWTAIRNDTGTLLEVAHGAARTLGDTLGLTD